MRKYIKELIPYFIIIITVILLRTYIITPVRVDGLSMYPTLENNEILLLKKYDHKFERFDIIVLGYENDKLVKRIVGLPGEYIEYKDNKLYVDGEIIKENFLKDTITEDFNIEEFGEKIPDNYYFVMGDNRGNSTDSRIIGFISEKDIKGTVEISIFPLNKLGKIK